MQYSLYEYSLFFELLKHKLFSNFEKLKWVNDCLCKCLFSLINFWYHALLQDEQINYFLSVIKDCYLQLYE